MHMMPVFRGTELPQKEMNDLLLLSAGRRVELAQAFKDELVTLD